MRKVLTIIGQILLLTATAAAFLLFFAAVWAFRTWPELKLEEMIYELQAPLNGTGGGLITQGILQVVLPACVLTVLAIALFVILSRRKSRAFSAALIGTVCVALFAVTAIWAEKKLHVIEYLKNAGDASSFIEDHYVDPHTASLTFPETKRNLVYIFLESAETTFADKENGGAFPYNCIPELTELAKENEDFSGDSSALNGGISLTGTTWTMGAMFAQTSGLPLKVSIGRNAMDAQETFFPEIGTLGDILEEEGYSQTLLIGSDATFGGRELYFTEHGGYFMDDYDYALAEGMIPQGYKVFWGYEDKKLFGFAKEKLTELAAGEQPFNLTMLTVDTHFEDGYVCDLCGEEFEGNRYANVFACSSRQVTEFVRWIEQQDFYENTTIVLMGDHPTMDADFCDGVSSDYQRKVYTCFINADAENAAPDQERVYTTFDAFPTTLAALGVGIEGERLGLGTNLFSGVPTLSEEEGLEMESAELKRKSEFLEKMEYVDPDAKLKKPAAYFRCDSYDEEKGELQLTVFDMYSMPGKLASIRAVITGPDGSSTSAEAAGSEMSEDGTITVTIPATPEQAVYGSIDVTAVDDAGTEHALLTGELSPVLLAESDFALYLKNLRHVLSMPDCTLLLAARGKYRGLLTDEMKEGLKTIGIRTDFEGADGNCFAAVIRGEEVQEEAGKKTASFEGDLGEGHTYQVLSKSGGGAGNPRITIDGNEFATESKGISAVVFSSRSGVISRTHFSLSKPKRNCTIEAVGRLMKLGRIHLQATDLPLSHPEWYSIAAVYWYGDSPDEARTIMMNKDTAERRTALLKGRIFPKDDLHIRIFAVISKKRWRVMGETVVHFQ